jgi:hypothetical protein
LETLQELARVTKLVRGVPGDVVECGYERGGTAAVLAWASRRQLHLYDIYTLDTELVSDLLEFLTIYHLDVTCTYDGKTVKSGTPETLEKIAFLHINGYSDQSSLPSTLKNILPKMSAGSIVAVTGVTMDKATKYARLFKNRLTSLTPTGQSSGVHYFTIK